MDYLVSLYLVRLGNYYRAFMTHNPEIDACFFFREQVDRFPNEDYRGTGEKYLDLLTPPVPIGVADYILKSVFAQSEIMGQSIIDQKKGGEPADPKSLRSFFSGFFSRTCSYEGILSNKVRKITALLEQIADTLEDDSLRLCDKAYPVRITPDGLKAEGFRPPDDGQAVLKALDGRMLFYAELEKSLLENHGEEHCDILNTLQFLSLSGRVLIISSMGFTSSGEITCHRCGNTAGLAVGCKALSKPGNLFFSTTCPICGFDVICCEQCNNLGGSRLCKALFATAETASERIGLPPVQLKVRRRGVPSLTPAQAKASREIKSFTAERSLQECLVWAACGAGKTEVILEAVQETLNSGGQVLYASPRRDVVIEIAPRLERAFEGVTINAVYGGSTAKFSSAGITAATTHQVIRFYRKFDLVIMDEVDAFPYKDNKMLQMAVKRAVKSKGQIIYLTATPSRELLRDADKGKSLLVTIPARYHGYPVPEPKLIKVPPFVKNGKGQMVLEPRVNEIIREWVVDRKGQVFVFLPTVKMLQIFEAVIEKAVREITGRLEPEFISFSYAQDGLRDYKRDCFKQGITRVFVTTSIMERGITVPNAYVIVLNSDFENIFDEGTLIQMAGRAGRSAEYPHCDVIFAGSRVTGAMKGAMQKIKGLNNEARKLGYLNPGW